MTADEHAAAGWSAAAYLRFLGLVVLAVALLAVIGYAVSAPAAGARQAMLAALGATGLASAAAGIPLARRGGPPHAAVNRALLAMLVRLGLVAVLAVLFLLRLEVALRPFLVWLVVGYLALLAVDTVWAVRSFRSL